MPDKTLFAMGILMIVACFANLYISVGLEFEAKQAEYRADKAYLKIEYLQKICHHKMAAYNPN